MGGASPSPALAEGAAALGLESERANTDRGGEVGCRVRAKAVAKPRYSCFERSRDRDRDNETKKKKKKKSARLSLGSRASVGENWLKPPPKRESFFFFARALKGMVFFGSRIIFRRASGRAGQWSARVVAVVVVIVDVVVVVVVASRSERRAVLRSVRSARS